MAGEAPLTLSFSHARAPATVHHGQFFTTPPSPYTCLGFLFNTSIAYLSDVSHIPPAVWAVLDRELAGTRLDALVVDCLRIEEFTSHFGVGQAVQTARRLGARRNYLVRLVGSFTRSGPGLGLRRRN